MQAAIADCATAEIFGLVDYGMDIRYVSSPEEFSLLREAWTRVLCGSRCNTVSLTFDWLDAWWKAFGCGSSLRVAVFSDSGAACGFAPLRRMRTWYRGLRVTMWRFLENDDTPRSDIVAGDALSEVIRSWARALRDPHNSGDVVVLRNIPRASDSFGLLCSALADNGVRFIVRPGLSSPFLPVSSSWNDYLKSRSSKLRQVLRNRVSRLKEVGYECVGVRDASDLPQIMRELLSVSARSWKARYRSDMSASPKTSAFFSLLSEAAARNGWLRVWLLRIGGKPAAYEYQLSYEGILYALRSDFDESFASYSPGLLLHARIVENAFADGIKELDMTGHTDAYKSRWTEQVREHAHLIIYGRTFLGRLLYWLDKRIVFPFMDNCKRIGVIRKLKKAMTGVGE